MKPTPCGPGCSTVSYEASPYWPTEAYYSNGFLYISTSRMGTATVPWPSWTDQFYEPTPTSPAPTPDPDIVCNAQWAEYAQRRMNLHAFYRDIAVYSTTTYVEHGACYSLTWRERNTDSHTGPVTKLCDGHVRALGPRESITSIWPDSTGSCIQTYSYTTWTGTLDISYNSQPNCTFESLDCASMWRTYSSQSSVWLTGIQAGHPTRPSPLQPYDCPAPTTMAQLIITSTEVEDRAALSSPSASLAPSPTVKWPPGETGIVNSDCAEECGIIPYGATVYYWPTADPDLCVDATTISEPTPTITRTAVVNGLTITSPSVYMYFKSIWATKVYAGWGRNVFCGPTIANVGVVFDKSQLTTVRTNGAPPRMDSLTMERYPFNLGDLNIKTEGNKTIPMVPWTAYTAGENCPYTWERPNSRDPNAISFDRVCTMVKWDYEPQLAPPVAIGNDLDTAFRACSGMDSNRGIQYSTLPLATPVSESGPGSEPTAASRASPESVATAPFPTAT
jgi:hypothetical protein